MNVKLISATPDAEKTMMYVARVSSPNQDSGNIKLLKFCIEHGHWSVFEHAFMTVEIETSRAISAQIIRHKSFAFSEFSQRYAKVIATMEYEARRQDEKNRQNSIDDLSEPVKNWFRARQEEIKNISISAYERALELGISKESARMLLPISTKTKLYMSGSVRSFLHYLDVRCDSATQLEHRDIADAIKQIFCEQFPIIAKAKGWIE